jgi:hypothetical protein
MTPTAVTPAGKAAARPVHRRTLPSRTAPSGPRRVSGPLRGRIAQPKPAPRVRRPARAVRQPLSARFAAFVRALPDHSLLDRVVRGRTWIALLGLMLVGIVAMQVEVLKLGASEGRALQESSALQSRNDILRADVSSESSEARIERLAASYGMVNPNPVDDVFLSPNATANANRAAHNITAPNPTNFISSLPEDQQTLDAGATGAGTTDPTDPASTTDTTGTTDTTDTPTTPAGDATGTDTTGAGDTTDGGDGGATTTSTSPTGTETTVTPVTPVTPSTTDTSPSGTDTGGGAPLATDTPAG